MRRLLGSLARWLWYLAAAAVVLCPYAKAAMFTKDSGRALLADVMSHTRTAITVDLHGPPGLPRKAKEPLAPSLGHVNRALVSDLSTTIPPVITIHYPRPRSSFLPPGLSLTVLSPSLRRC